MNTTRWKTLAIAAIVGAFFGWESAAWGPEAQRTISSTSIQMLRRTFSDAFRAGDIKFDADVVRGARDGVEAMRDVDADITVEQAMSVVSDQIRLLRATENYSRSSYFAYRMGALGSVVADLMVPYGIATTDRERALRERIRSDLDDNVTQFRYSARREGRLPINDARDYFRRHRAFQDNARQIIANDYATGLGFSGYLGNAASSYFQAAVDAVADAWFTVFRPQDPLAGETPTRAQIAWYLADEIEYLLVERGNVRQAERTYRHFARVNPGIHAAYEQVGDAFYAIESYDRAVREWENALDATGPERRRVVEKLARHYRDIGRQALGRAEVEPAAIDQALAEAERAFRNVLRYDQTDGEAAEMLTQAHTMIREREEQRQTVTRIMAGAESVLEQARSSVEEGDFGRAFGAFHQARNLLESVDEDFPEQYEAARNQLREINVAVRRTVNRILDRAHDTLADADRAREGQQFAEAIELYQQVPSILATIPEEEDAAFIDQKQDLISEADESLAQAQSEYERWQQQQEEAEEAAPPAEQEQPAPGDFFS